MQAEPAVFFLPPYIIAIIKSHGEKGVCAEDLSCDEGDKGVQEFGAGCAVTTVATGMGRQAVPGGLHLTTTDPHFPFTVRVNHLLVLSRLCLKPAL